MSDKPHPFSLIAIVMASLALVITFGLDYSQDNKEQPIDSVCHQSKECVDFLNKNYATKSALNNTNESLQMHEELSAFAVNEIFVAIDENKKEYTSEILKNKLDIRSNHPVTLDKEKTDEGDTGISETPFLTIELSQDQYIAGQSVKITGNANPDQGVQAYASTPDNRDFVKSGFSSANENGEYLIFYFTSLNQTPGNYEIYVISQDVKSERVSFKVTE